MAGTDKNAEAGFLGETPPLRMRSRRMPDKRRVSMRWLSGSVLAALTSTFLMGGALYAAMEGRERLALPALTRTNAAGGAIAKAAAKGDRPGLDVDVSASAANLMMVSTISREGDRDVVKVRPFLAVNSPLAAAPKRELSYPRFNALTIFAESGRPEPADQGPLGQIYGANVESEVTIKVVAFDPASDGVAVQPVQRANEIEELVRNAAPGLTAGATSLASLSYFDPSRFSFQDSAFAAQGVTITAENVSVVPKIDDAGSDGVRYEERVIRVRAAAPISVVLEAEGMDGAEAGILEKALSADVGASEFAPEDRIRVAYEASGKNDGAITRPGRVSVYRKGTHLVSIARSDDGNFVYAREPDPIPQVSAVAPAVPLLPPSRLPSAYDAIYRAALGEGLPLELAAKLVRIFAFDVDYNSAISAQDGISLFLSLEEGQEKPTEKSEILYAAVRLGALERQYFRFRDPETGQVDYYDENGKSAKKFLLRQPVPNGKFRSPFGWRVHPILRYRKMHTGVDWAAPRGTPIIAAGNGMVESAGWESGYGKQTVIRHANGYVTSYAHQSKILVKPGERVRQGQIIGHVGSTGLSTGPHLHYEVIVNGAKVDPMRIRLPKGQELKGSDLALFQAERDRLLALFRDREGEEELAQQF